ncbi:L,D-transpeptidase [Actinomycetospora endophytica]|uniref:L,D-transpeptidase n=1 Tax=Actinomycetospora endophytica TaxID=2291215 RepID=A0ABS8P9D2_9PSEU|nr:L,D-transpeptidase [Actinomycetospora endophytica]MCD2193629.1 L,D-transpeptidase [Actinomycetospora endophytica]
MAVVLAVLVVVLLAGGGALAPAPAMAAGATPCTTAVRVCVQLGAARAWLIDAHGTVVRGPVPITAGAPGMATPRGRFTVQRKDAHHMSPYGAMPWSVFFDNRGDALHGGNLHRQSRGCIHLAPADAEAFYNALSVGDRVEILP